MFQDIFLFFYLGYVQKSQSYISKEPFSFLYYLICLIGIIVLEFLIRDPRLDNMWSSVKMHFEHSFVNLAAFKGPVDVLLLAAEAG